MARSKSGEQARGKSKTAAAVEDLTRGVDKFHVLLAQVADLSREGFPYRDAVRAKTELQIRDTIKRVFGDKSSEYQTYKTFKLRTNTREETTQSVAFLKGLITSIENRKLDLLGIKPAVPPAPDASSPTQAHPQLSLVPPAAHPTQVTITPMTGAAIPHTPSPITMSVALTSNLGIPPGPPTPTTNQIPSIPESSRAGAAIQAIAPTSTPIHSPMATPPTPQAPAPHQPISPSIASPTQAAQPERVAQKGPTALASTQSAPVLSSTARPAPTATTSSTASTPPLAPSSQSGAERPAGSIAPPPASTAGNVVPSPPSTRSRARSSMRLSSPPGVESRPQAPAASSTRGSLKGDPPPSKPRNESAAVQRARPDVDPLEQVRKLCSRFHAVVRQMRLRREYRATLEVEDEYDVQDLLHSLLRLEFDEVEIEDWTPTYTQGANRTTFFLAKNTIAVVVKKTRPGLGGREIAEELKVDAERYAAHKDCGTLFCFVYDPEARIGNPRGFEADLTSICDSYTVQVLVAPK